MSKYFTDKDNNSYIDMLINQCYSILPLYEENGRSQILVKKIDNVFNRLNGFFKMNSFNPNVTIDILSFATELKESDSHKDVRRCVLKICALLSRLKVVVE